MITYIKQDIQGFYVEFPEEIDPIYWEGMIGETLEDFYDGKWIKLSNEQVIFHNENPKATLEQVWNMNIPERTLEDAKREKLLLIDDYDSSDNVNSFTVSLGENNTILHWLTPDQRANYKNSVDAAKLLGVEELHPVFNGIQLTIPTSTAEIALAQIQLYADRCFIITETHKAEVNALENIEEVDNYDIASGYPEKLTFTI